MLSSDDTNPEGMSTVAAPVNPPIRQSPVSAALMIPDGTDGDRIRRALAVLDAIYDDGQLSPFPVTFTRNRQDLGGYISESRGW